MKRVIDKRKKEKFMIDDEYLNGMARFVGHQGTLVYISLCRHAGKDQSCFPSIALMAKEHGVGIDTIKRGIKRLIERNVIDVKKKRTVSGTWLNNSYILLDKEVWNYNQSANSAVAIQSANNAIYQSANSATKETHIKETHILSDAKKCTDKGEWNFLKTLETLRSSEDRRMQIIAGYWRFKRISFKTKEAYQSGLKRELRASASLVGYENSRLADVFMFLDENTSFKWTLETVHKYVDEDLDVLLDRESGANKGLYDLVEKKYVHES